MFGHGWSRCSNFSVCDLKYILKQKSNVTMIVLARGTQSMQVSQKASRVHPFPSQNKRV